MTKRASAGERCLGFVIDFSVVGVMWFVANLFFDAFWHEPPASYGMILAGVLKGAYYVGAHARYGQTLGKFAMRTELRRSNDTPVGLGHALIRYVPYSVTTLGLISALPTGGDKAFENAFTAVYWLLYVFAFLDSVWIMRTSDRTSLCDMFADTAVFKQK